MMLDLKMKQFKGIVPLMVSLKNEAMRERHWKELMKKTGKGLVGCHNLTKLLNNQIKDSGLGII